MNKIFELTECQRTKILDEMKMFLVSAEFPITKEGDDGPFSFIDTEFSHASCSIPLRIVLDTHENTVCISIGYGVIPSGKRRLVSELISRLNMLMVVNRFVLTPDDHVLNFKMGDWLASEEFESGQVGISLQRLLVEYKKYTPLIAELLITNNYPKQILEKYLGDELKEEMNVVPKEKMH